MQKLLSTSSSLVTTLFVMTSLSSMTSSATEYVGQVRIYVDKSAADNWMKVTGKSKTWEFWEEMNSTIFEINQIYRTLRTNNVNIRLHIDDVRFLNKDILDTNDGKIVHKQSLYQFEKWVKPTYSSKQYDLAILFTGANLITEAGGEYSYGYAYIGTVCSAKALGVVELHGTYNDVLATAHEIGHIFGADHDGTKTALQCSGKSGEIMNALTKNDSPKHFFFSSCSASSIRTVLNKLGSNNCLSRWYTNGEISGPRFASLMTPDQICQRKFGRNSYIARKAYKSYGDNVCTQVACMTKTVGTYFYWTFELTPQGLNCGQNKQCIQGKCVTSSGGNAQVSDTCPFGDQPKIEGDFQTTCSQMTSSKCPNWNNTCCQSCSDPGTADQVCKRLQGKNSAMARRAFTNGYGDLLCSKLACLTSVTGTYFRWNYYTAPDGMKCGKNKRCNNGRCETHNLGDPNMSDTCPYGDQPWLAGDWQKTCADYTAQKGCGGNGWKSTCCVSCNDPGTADAICRNLVGKDSVMARRAYTSYGNNLCSKLACMTKVSGTMFHWRTFTAPDGMKCGQNRRCSKGRCLWTSTGDSSMSSTCPYGDQPWLAGNWRSSCKDYVRKNGCSGQGWKQICCNSC